MGKNNNVAMLSETLDILENGSYENTIRVSAIATQSMLTW